MKHSQRKTNKTLDKKQIVQALIDSLVAIPDLDVYISKYLVTQELWTTIMKSNPSKFRYNMLCPVEGVSFEDCLSFIKKLNNLVADIYMDDPNGVPFIFKLPTEDEWGKANEGVNCFTLAEMSDESRNLIAWYADNSGGRTHPVGLKQPNALGLYDMIGNVSEWTTSTQDDKEDCFSCVGGHYSSNKGHEFFNINDWFDGRTRKERIGLRLAAQTPASIEAQRQREEAAFQEKMNIAKEAIQSILKNFVQIPGKKYLVNKFVVTEAQWHAIMMGIKIDCDVDYPITNITYDMACDFVSYINRFSEVEAAGMVIGIPTFDEWGYACLAGANGNFAFVEAGKEGDLDQMGWWCSNSNDEIHPIAQKKPNAWGLYDMYGNVWEWTSKGHHRWEEGFKDIDNPEFMCCGGCFLDSINSVNRKIERAADFHSNYIGLRLVAKFKTDYEVEHTAALEEVDILNDLFDSLVPIPGTDIMMSRYLVTQKLWDCVLWTYSNSAFKGDLNLPVENISFRDCEIFIRDLNSTQEAIKVGLQFRIPTKEEWEYACRAGSTGKYGLLANGREGTLDEMAWYVENSRYETHPVGQKMPNAWGLYDMHGNVWEYVSSPDESGYYACGGGYASSAEECASNSLNYGVATIDAVPNIGLRLVAEKMGCQNK